MSRESFLARWSRCKLGVQDEYPIEHEQPAVSQDGESQPVVRTENPAEPAPFSEPDDPPARAELPSLDSINRDTDMVAFFRPGVEEGLRRQALKKLFSDPCFNVMDGLDVYIDDYSKKDPIPSDVLEGLMQAHKTLMPDQDTKPSRPDERLSQAELPADIAMTPEPPPEPEEPPREG